MATFDPSMMGVHRAQGQRFSYAYGEHVGAGLPGVRNGALPGFLTQNKVSDRAATMCRSTSVPVGANGKQYPNRPESQKHSGNEDTKQQMRQMLQDRFDGINGVHNDFHSDIDAHSKMMKDYLERSREMQKTNDAAQETLDRIREILKQPPASYTAPAPPIATLMGLQQYDGASSPRYGGAPQYGGASSPRYGGAQISPRWQQVQSAMWSPGSTGIRNTPVRQGPWPWPDTRSPTSPVFSPNSCGAQNYEQTRREDVAWA